MQKPVLNSLMPHPQCGYVHNPLSLQTLFAVYETQPYDKNRMMNG